jgi:hypothetical protein
LYRPAYKHLKSNLLHPQERPTTEVMERFVSESLNQAVVLMLPDFCSCKRAACSVARLAVDDEICP